MQAIDEEIFYFSGSKKRSLLGFLHKPQTFKKSIGIIFCHPFAEEKNISHVIVAKTARALADTGYPVMRYDMSGCGDSEGELDEVNIKDWQEDLKQTISCIKRETGVEKYALWGLRTGSGLALLHVAQNKDVQFLILWQPVIDFEVYIRQFLRQKISNRIVTRQKEDRSIDSFIDEIKEKGKTTVIGYPITNSLCESFIGVSQKPSLIIPACPTLILSISMMVNPQFAIKSYVDMLISMGNTVKYQHVTAEPFWDRYWRWECFEATRATADWAEKLG